MMPFEDWYMINGCALLDRYVQDNPEQGWLDDDYADVERSEEFIMYVEDEYREYKELRKEKERSCL